LAAQLRSLHQQLQGFDELKEEFVRHGIELGWEEQHLEEIEDQKKAKQKYKTHV
jgi:hypothetical protein